jgi:ferredoxin
VPTVVFESNGASPLILLVPEGGALVDVCDEHQAPVPFACKSANCGACLVEILEGEAELLPARQDERDVLARLAAEPSAPPVRLACQAKTRPGLATLRLRAKTTKT